MKYVPESSDWADRPEILRLLSSETEKPKFHILKVV